MIEFNDFAELYGIILSQEDYVLYYNNPLTELMAITMPMKDGKTIVRTRNKYTKELIHEEII